MKTERFFLVTASVLLCSCASTTSIIPAGVDTYMVAGRGGQFLSGAEVKAGLYQNANIHCESIGKKFLPLSETVRPETADTMSSAELTFRCLKEGDAELVRPIMRDAPNIRIEQK